MTVEVDREQLKIALKNLIKNSLQAIEPGGKISIEAFHDTIDDADFIRIILRDSGSGIHEDIRDKIFQPLFTTRTRGIGFGLSIVKMVIEKHGGKISARNNRNGGARFEIILPAG